MRIHSIAEICTSFYFYIKCFYYKTLQWLRNLIATLLENEKHHLVLNRVEELMKIVYEQYGEINGIRIQNKRANCGK